MYHDENGVGPKKGWNVTTLWYQVRLWCLKIAVFPWTMYYSFLFEELSLRNIVEDYVLFLHIFVFHTLNMQGLDDPQVIVDAGAYSGLSTLYFAYQFPDAQIIAVEPAPQNFRLLRQHTEHLDKVTCVNKAVWDTKNSITIADRGVGEWGYTAHRQTGHNTVEIDTMTMQDVLQMVGGDTVDLLKVDIEGSEKTIFSDGAEWVKSVDAMIVETHDFIVDGCEDALWAAIDSREWSVRKQGRDWHLQREETSS